MIAKENKRRNDTPNTPTPDAPLLIGILVDVSASMKTSIESSVGSTTTRLESLKASLDDLIHRATDLSASEAGETVLPLIRIFALGFGFGNPLDLILGKSGPSVRNLLTLSGDENEVLSIDTLAKGWGEHERNLERLSRSMLGSTPMTSAFRRARDIFAHEVQSHEYFWPPILFVLSDGVPTDGKSDAVIDMATEIDRMGIVTVSCYVTANDTIEARKLYGRPVPNWSEGARLMFNCASALPPSSPFEFYLKEYGWELELDSRLFTQINQSEVLSEFLEVIVSPLRTSESAATADPSSSTVFISYSHRDARWLDRLRVHLRPLERAGLLDVWVDQKIAPGANWRANIDTALARANVAVLLISADFLASDFIAAVELPKLLRDRQRTGLRVLPVIVGPCLYEQTAELNSIQSINAPSRPLSALKRSDAETKLKELAELIEASSRSA